jgi:hypothetical protein
MTTIRMMSPAKGSQVLNTGAPSPRIYDGRTAGVVVDVPINDAQYLGANGWINIANSGPTSARPVDLLVGIKSAFLDTTIGQLIIFDGQLWRSAVTGSAV